MKLVSVQYLRAIAALLVVFAHLSGFSAFQAISTAHFGGFGVDLFFVVSGFIMWHTSDDRSPADFMYRRIARIVPPYWFYTTLLVLLAFLMPRLAPNIQLSPTALVGSYLFIPYADHRGIMNPILLQGWTLNFEMYFYLVFACGLFIPGKSRRFTCLIAFFMLSAMLGLFADRSWAILSQITSSILLEFCLGMIVAAIWQRQRISTALAWPVVAISGALLVIAEFWQPVADVRFIAFGVPAALLLYGLLNCETYFAKRPISLLLRAGDASYSLYLVHPFVLSAVHLIVNRALKTSFVPDPVLLGSFFGITAIAASLVVAHVSYIHLERRAEKFLLRTRQHRAPLRA